MIFCDDVIQNPPFCLLQTMQYHIVNCKTTFPCQKRPELTPPPGCVFYLLVQLFSKELAGLCLHSTSLPDLTRYCLPSTVIFEYPIFLNKLQSL